MARSQELEEKSDDWVCWSQGTAKLSQLKLLSDGKHQSFSFD
jgi:hypothetical protein